MHYQNKQTRQRNRLAIFSLSNIYFLCKWVCLKAGGPLFAESEHYSYYPFSGNNNILTLKEHSVKQKNEKFVNFSRNDATLTDKIALKLISHRTHPISPTPALFQNSFLFFVLKGKKRLRQSPRQQPLNLKHNLRITHNPTHCIVNHPTFNNLSNYILPGGIVMNHIDSKILPSIDPTQLESVCFEGVYTVIRTLDSPNDEYSFKLATFNDACYYAELFDYLISIFNCPWTLPSGGDIKAAILLFEYFNAYFTSGPNDLLDVLKNYSPRYPQIDQSWADICLIRVGADNGNLTLNPRHLRRASSNRHHVDIEIERSDIDIQFEFRRTIDATLFGGHVNRIIEIYNASHPPTQDQVATLLSEKRTLQNYLRPKSYVLLRRVHKLLTQGCRAVKVEDHLLLTPLYIAER